MIRRTDFPTAEPFLPQRVTLPSLREAASACEGCPLYKSGVQTVFGEGPAGAAVMFIGEQPGDQEDRAGKPFVGPSGKLLDEALQEVGIDRNTVYITNAVKHFKWMPRGKRRIHVKPTVREMAACKPWLLAELQVVNPRVVVCLGATAAKDLLGSDFRITRDRGKAIVGTPYAPWLLATFHPSAILRMPTPLARETAWRGFLSDLTVARSNIS